MKNNFSNNREYNSLSKLKHNTAHPIKSAYTQQNTEKHSKQFKFQNMSKLIVSKIDEILKEQPLTSASACTSVYPNLKESLNAKLTDEIDLSENLENKLNIDPQSIKEEIKPPMDKRRKSTKLRKNPKTKKEVFMTDVDIQDNLTPYETKKKSKYMEEKDKQIREMLDNIDDSDGILDEKEEKEFLRRNPEKRDEVIQIKNLIAQVDNYKKSLTDEFDELQFLIKFVDETADRINRHKQGVSRVFKRAGLKPKTDFEIPEAQEINDERTYYAQDGSYDTKKNLSVVKTNLNKIYDSMLDFYSKFNNNKSDKKENENEYTADLGKYRRKNGKK